VVELFKEKQLA